MIRGKHRLYHNHNQKVFKRAGTISFPGFTSGQSTHEAVVRFPDGKSPPIYISVTEVSTLIKLKATGGGETSYAGLGFK
ncbi:hypothetical protein EIN43_07720 [Enterobacter hormaechei]|uniref:Pyosin/cloacin translocation domain-containing protein n=1 Tax=Enterobacter hormaechei TaxID=158836 RepID=A0A4Y5ZQY8_9ENTR|nr:hypothetical protein EIN43_07720 [Enterobacter hormaechei]